MSGLPTFRTKILLSFQIMLVKKIFLILIYFIENEEREREREREVG